MSVLCCQSQRSFLFHVTCVWVSARLQKQVDKVLQAQKRRLVQSRPVQRARLVHVGSVAKQQCGQVVVIVQNSCQRKRRLLAWARVLLRRSNFPAPATNGESCSSFWRSGLQPFCNKKVAFSLSPRTTARKRGVSPFSVRHWAAPGGEAEIARLMSESHKDNCYRCRSELTWEDNLKDLFILLRRSFVQWDPSSLIHSGKGLRLYCQSIQGVMITWM